MAEQPVDDPVREASSRLVQGASLAAMAAETLTQAWQSRAAARNAADAAVIDQVQQGVAQAAARVAWAPLLQRGLRAHLTEHDVVQGRAAADLWSPGIWKAERAREHAQRRQAAANATQPGESAGDRRFTVTALALPTGPAAPSPTTPSHSPRAAQDSGSPPPSVTAAASASLVAPSLDGRAPALATVAFPEPLTGTVLTRSGGVVHDAGATYRPSAVALTPGLHQPNGLTR